MPRALVDREPAIDIRRCIRQARGSRAGPRAAHERRLWSDGNWDGKWLTFRAYMHEHELWSLRVRITVRGRQGTLQSVFDHDGLPTVQRAVLTGEPMRFGGCRWWAVCPACQRRCAALFVTDAKQLKCRICSRLAYQSTRKSDADRSRLGLERLAARLGEEYEWRAPIPERPRKMWRSTYRRIYERWLVLERRERQSRPHERSRITERGIVPRLPRRSFA